ncbi:GNAT family N-acetyltransferase [Tundrisphaera lichenicola]|uniref:GNAT family N-acetyltransferase n=1 Tax=Tundrisphaera lichenicola TaxID=2029860 RepID=UPI003EBF55F2
MIFSDHDLATRLEGLEARFSADCARARREFRPESDTVALAVGGGFALFLGEDSPLNEAKGMGMSGPVSADELAAMERVFLDRGGPAKVMVCPMSDPSLLSGLAARGFRPVGFEDVLYRELDPGETFPAPPEGVEILWAGPDDAETLTQTVARGFVAPDEPGPGILEIMSLASRAGGMMGLLARVEGEPAGGASILIRDGLAMLAGASTLPKFRNRGIQTALARARLARAAKAGCELVTMGAEPGSTSHRNAERLGLRVAYTKLVLVLDPS